MGDNSSPGCLSLLWDMLCLLWRSFWCASGLLVRIMVVPGCTVQAQFAIGHMIEPMHTSHAGPAQNSEVGHCLTTGPKLAGAPPGTWKCFC